MNKFMLLALAILLSLFASAESKWNESGEWVSLDEPDAQLILEAVVDNTGQQGLHLLNWGWMKDDCLTDGHDTYGDAQIWFLSGDKMVHTNTDDGNFCYDMKISGSKILVSNQKKWNGTDFISQSNSRDGWIKLLGIDTEGRMLTIDYLGVYRVFNIITLDELMGE